MNIGINPKIDRTALQHYEAFYDLLPTPNHDEQSRLLRPQHSMLVIGPDKNRTCRFCNKKEHEVSFKKIAHAFPESIGNHVLASNYECDTCNQFFGDTIENDYNIFFSLYHSIMQISGKRGIPKCKFKVPCSSRTDTCAEYCVELSLVENRPLIRKCREVDNKYISCSDNSITLSKPVGHCCPIAVFKAIVKMAITVMPVEELPFFIKTIQWLLEPEHHNYYADRKLLVRYKMIPGFHVVKYPHYCLYRRKKTVWNQPYMLFHLTYGCFSILIEIPSPSKGSNYHDFEKMPFPPIPFYTSEEGIWDLSGNELPKKTMHSIELNFETIQDCTNLSHESVQSSDAEI